MNKRLLYWLGGAVSLLSTVYFVRALGTHWRAATSIVWSGSVHGALALALLLYLLTYLLASQVWKSCLKAVGQSMAFSSALVVLMLSQIGKYLPGNVGHHVGRVVLARNAGIPGKVALASLVLESLLVLAAGLGCSVPAWSVLIRVAAARLPQLDAIPLPLVTAVGSTLALLSLAVAWRYWRKKAPPDSIRIAFLSSSIAAWLALCANFMLGGAALFILVAALAGHPTFDTHGLAGVIGVYSAAWVLGFLMPGSPAGLGVREIVLLFGLAPVYGAPAATMAAALLRLVTVSGDGLAFLLALLLRTWHGHRLKGANRPGQEAPND